MTPHPTPRMTQDAWASAQIQQAMPVLISERAEAEREAVKCGRRVNILLDAGEYQAAREMLEQAKQYALLAIEETERRAK